ncbi:hypothetical protein AK88_04708 [Plasmodium fragile]|uniref:Uncharacterized protein n=1 Tax=Plasmodium fragile TaxID=5857 RepID=A0A0D9QFU6_PLAFR|nr:uncharacterized protein AK88_04708 [Plasmodium fragile]KJP85677.1 hypothetical protein AK88_04708 [Plasmodium fragile]
MVSASKKRKAEQILKDEPRNAWNKATNSFSRGKTGDGNFFITEDANEWNAMSPLGTPIGQPLKKFENKLTFNKSVALCYMFIFKKYKTIDHSNYKYWSG